MRPNPKVQQKNLEMMPGELFKFIHFSVSELNRDFREPSIIPIMATHVHVINYFLVVVYMEDKKEIHHLWLQAVQGIPCKPFE